MKRRCRARSSRTGEQCKRPPCVGGVVCASHGGRAPQTKAAAERRLDEAEARRQLAAMLHDPDAPPVVNPARALLRLLGRMQAAVDVLGERVNQLEDLHYVDAQLVNRVRATVALYVELTGELRRGLTDASRLQLEALALAFERRVVEQHGDEVAALVRVIVLGVAERLAGAGVLPEGFAPMGMDAIRAAFDRARAGELVPLPGYWDLADDPEYVALVDRPRGLPSASEADGDGEVEGVESWPIR